jgi:hypothetical protein
MKKILFVLAAFAALLFGAMANAQTQINQANISSFPYVITQPGSYILTSNITVSVPGTTAIFIQANNVVLNLNGYSVSGPLTCTGSSCNSTSAAAGVYGIAANATIENGSISGFYYGAEVFSGSIRELQFSSCVYCIYAYNAAIRHNTIIGSAQNAIYAFYSNVGDNTISQAYGTGIYGSYSSIINNSVYQTTGGGLEGVNSSVVNNTVGNSSTWGIVLYGGYAGGNTSMNNTTSDLNLYSYAVSTKNNACTKGAC